MFYQDLVFVLDFVLEFAPEFVALLGGVDWQRADWSNLVEPACPKTFSSSWGNPWLGSIWRG